MKIFLTGGSGFVGKNLLEQLSGKYQFIAPEHKQLDLLDSRAVSDFLQEGKFDIVIHSANVGGNRAQIGLAGVYETNCRMFLNLSDNQKSFGRMIFLGSGAEYGKQESVVNAKESDFGKRQPEDDYGRVKYFASQEIVSMGNAVNLRCFGVFGKYEDYKTRFISNTICRTLFNLPIVIRQNVRFDYIYVKDLVRIIAYFISHEPKEKFYNVGSGQPVELTQLAEMVKTATGGKAEIKIKNPGYNKEYTCSNSRLLAEIKDFNFTPHQEAITELVDYYKNNLSSIKREDLGFDE